MKLAKAITNNSFRITRHGLILELKHSEEGLPKGTKLISEKSGRIWEVLARILFEHIYQKQILFKTESIEYILNRFDSIEKEKNSIQKIMDEESQGIYQYFVKPLSHDEKPEHGEKLIIQLTN